MNSLSREISMVAGAIQENKYEIIVINVLCKHKVCSCGVSAEKGNKKGANFRRHLDFLNYLKH